MKAQDLIHTWLASRLPAAALAWLGEKSSQLSAGAPEKVAFTSFSAAVRHTGKDPLNLDGAALQAAAAAVEGWNPSDWTVDQAARIRLLLALPPGEASARIILQIHQTADVAEAIALQKALPLLPDPEAHMAWAREGIRSNIQGVFEAVTLRNPYPAKHFDETGWNQMVTKTFFMESPLEEVWGLDRRANAALGQILADLAFERWAAGRTFSPMLWRCVGPVAHLVPGGRAFAALEKALSAPAKRDAMAPDQLGEQAGKGHAAGRNAAALALCACPAPEAARLLAARPALADLAAAVKSGALTWENFHARQS